MPRKFWIIFPLIITFLMFAVMKGKLLLRIDEIIPETPRAATFVFDVIEGGPVHYKAGQFLTFIFERQGKEVRRSYSLSSAPGIDARLSVTVKEVTNGEFSRYMLTALKVGDVLTALPPAGRFTLPESFRGGADIFLLAAGSGIVPVYSILKKLLSIKSDLRITLVYSNVNERNTLFREEIEGFARKHAGRFQCIHILTRPRSLHADGQAEVIYGHLNNHLLEQLVLSRLHYDKSSALVYICGPFTYMRMAQITLRVNGFTEEQLRRENFVIKEAVPPRFVFPEGPYPKEVRLRVSGNTYRLQVEKGQTVLDAALKEGLDLPYSCKAGVCTTCLARCSKGAVKMSVNESLTGKDLEKGLILTCVAYPLTEKVAVEL